MRPSPQLGKVDTAKSGPTPLAVPMQPRTPLPTAQPVVPVASPLPLPISDPIEEAAEALWYVRPPSGGQYGPARGEIMRKWIGEGRVSSDSLVWREGWEDWQTAGEVFPTLGGRLTPPVPGSAIPGAYLASPPPSDKRAVTRPRRRNSVGVAVSAVVVLGLICVALFIALLVVLSD